MRYSFLPWVAALLLTAGCNVIPSMSSIFSSKQTPSPAPASAPAATSTPVAVSPAAVTDFVVIPGDRVGSITSTTSRNDLAQRFGEDHLNDEDVPIGEGFFEPGTWVDLGDGRSLSIVWTDEARTKPAEVRNLGPDWKLPEGIGVGTSFTELQQILGPFELAGFGWDYGGTLLLEGTNLAEYEDKLVLRVQPKNPDVAESSGYQAVLGDQMIADSDPHLRSLNLQVDEMIVYLEPRQ